MGSTPPQATTCVTAAGVCTWRAAVGEPNATAGAETITLPAGTCQLTIANTESDAATSTSSANSLTITGAGAATTRREETASAATQPVSRRPFAIFTVWERLMP